MTAFVDTSVWFAAAAKRDAQNERAKSILRSIGQHITTDLVLTETWQLLKAKFGKDVADNFWERLRDSGVQIELVIRADLDAASEIEASFPNQSFSFIDRTSFALMERLGITRAATFSPDFAAYRPRRGRKRPFQILSEGHSEVFTALREALLERRPVHVSNDGERQTVCPYIVGHAAGEERAFALLVEASSSTKRPDQDRWICLRLSKIEDVRPADERWIERDYPGPVQRCVDQVHLEWKRLTTARG
ncbi:type II toxin-antitoxin system VapC family toxin [Bradyrhizobium sp. 182]|uniref:type II toxin-antitoxin system VapC family toxin n=1 Tax=unclassified Bradyrhizobium TaxID=2631580 RepID=UPI001FF97E47|nr:MULTISPECIES: PIN domain-containing protein [unclassified Bradyrhizobium]MCK1420274.1 type II toxin-antitoxin system VapC family toxin [Bradyrhizobium sp. CW12]MCK1527552.1 type II toxin-antitoxin system VapC family toxin [Bradyrhizobium sp. 182]MCK1646790.1 type II toxin-antitoxin system VapC family toxin [Bradyrhizobium sp. 154]